MAPEDATEQLRASRRDLVRRGYDAISRAYRDDEGRANPGSDEGTDQYTRWVDDLSQLLRPRARVLDLGCGAGVPATKLLIEKGFEVLGLDISGVQIERARRLVSGANFEQADMVTWEHEPASFDAVVSFYALIHVPLGDQRNLLPKIRRWLRPGGYLLAIVGFERWTGIEDYFGAEMFWDHADRETYLSWLTEARLAPLWDRFVPEGNVGHTLVLAQAVSRPISQGRATGRV
ncbi:MAG TPA: class I SAM-dependent methyltransferase [Methylomirabilota bacterium]|nr:class I SAM-dependent methyltransferase [Methylomirabilota bacterium]